MSNENLHTLLEKGSSLTKEELIFLLSITNKEDFALLSKKANDVQRPLFKDTVHYRGLIEFSNICVKNCLYCGIRAYNTDVDRYTMTREEILETALWNYENDYGSITLQSGERYDEEFILFVEDILKNIKKLTNDELGITLCCGEQSKETYERWFAAGAHRYLLRIETSNPELYQKIHPNDALHSHKNRIRCLHDIRDIDYQLGTGVMIGLPYQTLEDLANDILFFRDIGAHMIGMGPYIVHSQTPLGKTASNEEEVVRRRFQLGLNMVAVTRIFLPSINIAATTALQALDPIGREKAVLAGANILMPITTKKEYRPGYTLYDNKPCIEDTSEQCKQCLASRMTFSNKIIGYGQKGDSPLYLSQRR